VEEAKAKSYGANERKKEFPSASFVIYQSSVQPLALRMFP